MKKFSCDDAKQIDMVEYLASLNIYPANIRNQDYWYLSPLPGRNEKEPSFKINRKKNVWYDHSLGKGGDLINFGTLYHNCSVSELLHRLSEFQGCSILSFHPPAISGIVPGAKPVAGEKKETTDSKIVLVETRALLISCCIQNGILLSVLKTNPAVMNSEVKTLKAVLHPKT